MSLVLRQAGSLKPEIRLAQAVSEFEATLTPEQKSSFQASRARAVSTAPTMSDVMRLTAEIDLKATSKHGRGRCFGPRMTNTLQAIQQFAALGDVIVGGGQNLIACGVWATARMTLHVITGYFTYLESLSLLLMTIGRNAPRYQAMASLYPKSKSLQRYLCEYFIIITNLCYQSVVWTKKSALSRLSSIISDPQMKSFKDDLDLWSSSIKEEVSLLLNQTLVEEAKQNSLFRSFAAYRSDRSAHGRKLIRQIRFLDACSEYDYRTTWKQKRKCGTTRLIKTCHPYQHWSETSQETSILFLGKLGAGKSVLLANIVDDLNLQNDAITLYFFARYDSEESMKARTIFGSLIRQLLEYRMEDPEASHLFRETVNRLDLDDILNLFRLANPVGRAVSIILDGLDECDIEVQRTILEHLGVIKAFGYKLCLSGRSYEKGTVLSTHSFQFIVTIQEANPDITDFVEVEVDSRVRNGMLVTRDPHLVEEIKRELITRACGMFLWTSLQLDSICSEVSDHDIRETIQNLPRDLTETYRRNLAKASLNDYKRHHVRIFKILVSAKELLTTEQLRQAASVIIGQTVWNPEKEISRIHPVIRFCGSLITIDEEEDTVRFVHHSARSFCIKGPHATINWAFSELEANQHMAEILVTYLNYNLFHTTVSRFDQPLIEVEGVPKKVAIDTLSSYRFGKTFAEKILGSTSQLKYDLGATLVRASINGSQGDQFPLLAYAKKHWLHHTAHLKDLPLLPQWHTLLESPTFGIDNRRFATDMLKIFPDLCLITSKPPALVTSRYSWEYSITSLSIDINFETSPMLQAKPRYRNLYWALFHGHLLTLNYELTKTRGSQRIMKYVMLWSILKLIALSKPSIIMEEFSYELVRWLSPMFINLAMDHPAKKHFLRRILTSDECYMELVRNAVKNVDFVAISALIRSDYEYQTVSFFLEWDDGFHDVPPILEATLSRSFDKTKIQEVIQSNNVWLFDLATWFFRTGQPWYYPSIALDSLQQAKVPSCEIRLLQKVLSTVRDQFAEKRSGPHPIISDGSYGLDKTGISD